MKDIQNEMLTLFKRLYIMAIIEAWLLAIVLYAIPAELANNLIFGRSIYRWALILPALILALSGSIHLTTLILNNKANISIEELRTYLFSTKPNFGDQLVFYNLLYLASLLIVAILLRKHETAISIRLLPWLIFTTIILAQADYFLYKLMAETSARIEFKQSLINIPATAWNIFLEDNGVYASEDNGRIRISWFRATCIIILISAFLLVEYETIVFGQLNADEGWILYAAKQVYRGHRPYQDFAFTQMPLIPYVYGTGLLVWHSVYTGRLISFLIFCSGLILIYLISKQSYNLEILPWLLLVFIAYPESIYFSSIVKTYGLTFFFFVLSFYTFTSNSKPEIKFPVLFGVLLLGTLTRLTFAAFALGMGLGAMLDIRKLQNKSKILFNVATICLPIMIWGASFFYPKYQVAIWNIYEYHKEARGLGFSKAVISEFLSHIKEFVRYNKIFWPLRIPLVLSLISSAWYGNLNRKENRNLLIAALGITMFLSLHFIAPNIQQEYYVPAIMFIVTILVWFLFSFSDVKSGINILIIWITRATLLFITLTSIGSGYWFSNYEQHKGNPPIEILKKVAVVVNHYYPNEPIFVLEGLYITTEANRDALSGLSMGPFSIVDMNSDQATDIHLLNNELMTNILKSRNTKILVLTERELASLESSVNGFNLLLEKEFVNVFQTDHFGQKSTRVYVFTRK